MKFRVAIALVLVAAAMPASLIDVAVIEWFRDGGLGRWPHVQTFIRTSEFFGHWLSLLFLVVLICRLEGSGRRRFGYLFTCSTGAGLAAVAIKCIVHRSRPIHLISAGKALAPSFQCGWFHLRPACELTGSFPSGHTAAAAGLACALSQRYPQGTIFFVTLACCAGVQRMQSLAHFPSDVLVGGAVGILTFEAARAFRDRLRKSDGRQEKVD